MNHKLPRVGHTYISHEKAIGLVVERYAEKVAFSEIFRKIKKLLTGLKINLNSG